MADKTGGVENDSFDERLTSTDWLEDQMFSWKNLLLLIVTAGIFLVTKGLFVAPIYFRKFFVNKEQLAAFHTIDDQLVKKDNKAVAIQFAGFLIGTGLVVRGSLSTNRSELGEQLLDCLIFTVLGFLMIGIAHIITDVAILWRIDSVVAVVRDHNVAVAIMVAALHVCTGLILGFSITIIPNEGYGEQIATTLLWFFVGHLCLIVFAWVYMIITKYDDLAMIKQNVPAAAIGFGLVMIADALMIASPISKKDSFLAVAISWGLGSIVLLGLRAVVDTFVLRSRSLDNEISDDSNWGAALIEGMSSVAFSLVWWSLYRVDKSDACTPDTAS